MEISFPCVSCGGKLEFAPGTTALKCPFCATENVIDNAQDSIVAEELDYLDHLHDHADSATTIEQTLVKCNACGAETNFAPTVVADDCPFCATPIVLDQQFVSTVIKPQYLVPFQLDHIQAREAFKTWLKTRWFAPNALKEHARRDKPLQGVYVPYWTYDSDTYTRYRGRRGTVYYVTVQRGDQKVQERRVRWTSVSGNVSRFFDDILIVASESLPKRYVDRLNPWQLNALVNYDEKFISGFKAEHYQVPLENGWQSAQQYAKNIIQSDIRRDIGGDLQEVNHTDTHWDNITFKHVLLPIWTSSFRYNNKRYQIVINGQSGEVQGERPYSIIKIAAATLLGLGIAALIYFIYLQAQ